MICNQGATGSNPVAGTMIFNDLHGHLGARLGNRSRPAII